MVEEPSRWKEKRCSVIKGERAFFSLYWIHPQMRKTRQCFINSNDFHSRRSTRLRVLGLCHSARSLLFLFFYLLLLLFHHAPPSSSCDCSPPLPHFFFLFVYCMILLTPTFICLCAKKRQALFFPPRLLCLPLTHFSPHPVSCVFSPISGILRSPPSM